MSSDRIKGTCVRSVIGVLSREGLLEPAMASLSSMSREVFLGGVLATGWYPVDAYIELLDAVAARAGLGAEGLMLRVGKQIVSDGLTTVYRVFLPVDSPFQGVSRGQYLWRTYFKNSELNLLRAGKGVADFEVTGEARTSPAYCLTKLGGMIGSLELIGASGVQGEHPSCRHRGDATCRFQLTWEE